MGSKPVLTVGMAHHSDFFGLWQTIQDLRLDHLSAIGKVELIVVDNSPGNAHSTSVQNFLAWVADGVGFNWEGKKIHPNGAARREKNEPLLLKEHPADVRYLQLGEQGTTQSRERIFKEAKADAVLVMDCHVKLWPGCLEELIEFYERGEDEGNLLQGVLVYDNLNQYHTHFEDVLRGNMQGIWATDPRGFDMNGEPFEIPAQGLGVFSCRKENWLGFNKRFRGFGGEECYIHEKFRQHGKKTLCLPFLRWVHRFDRPGGTGYTNDLRHRVRNYLIGHQELNLPIDRLRKYFRDGIPEDPKNEDPNRTRISPMEWDILCTDLEIE